MTIFPDDELLALYAGNPIVEAAESALRARRPHPGRGRGAARHLGAHGQAVDP
jgi:hypothetical protein